MLHRARVAGPMIMSPIQGNNEDCRRIACSPFSAGAALICPGGLLAKMRKPVMTEPVWCGGPCGRDIPDHDSLIMTP